MGGLRHAGAKRWRKDLRVGGEVEKGRMWRSRLLLRSLLKRLWPLLSLLLLLLLPRLLLLPTGSCALPLWSLMVQDKLLQGCLWPAALWMACRYSSRAAARQFSDCVGTLLLPRMVRVT